MSKTQIGQDTINKGKQAIAPIKQQFNKAVTPVTEKVSKAIAPTANLINPIVNTLQNPQKKTPTLFSDEKTAFEKMMADSIPEADAMEAIKSRRQDLLG